MTDPIPPGTRDVLPQEMAELRRIEATLVGVFGRAGYGEVATPAIEYHDVLARGDLRGAPEAYRLFDESGGQLALRTDMTVPIARLVANRLPGEDAPFRLFYIGSAFRAIRPQRGQMREFRQAGVELIGADAPAGTGEVIEVLATALDSVGLTRAVIGLGDADLYRQLLDELDVPADRRAVILERLAAHDLVGLEADVAATGAIGEGQRETLLRLTGLRGGPEVLDHARELGGEAVERATRRLAATYEELERRGVAGRVSLDLGLLRDLGYYTGAIVEVYDPALGHVLGGGGRYDGLLGRFGRPMPAAGFALHVERLHIAQAEEERLEAARAGRDPGEGT